MDNFLKFIILLWAVFFLFFIYQIFSYIKFKLYLKSLQNKPCICKKYLEKLQDYKKLPPHIKDILEFKIKRFIREKKFIPKYMQINDEIKCLIAFYACLLTIAYKNFCYPSLKYIYIYPHTIIKEHINQNGIIKKEMLISGESIKEAVIIAWDEVKKEIYHYKKRNVIIHEFAHELDFEEGIIDGIPIFAIKDYEHFKKIFNETFQKAIKDKVLDEYAFSNKAEFFAVTTEYFFLKPRTLKTHYPKLFEEYIKIFKFNPLKMTNIA